MSLNEDMRTLAAAKTRLNHLERELEEFHETDLRGSTVSIHEAMELVIEQSQLMEFIIKLEAEIRVKFAVKKHWFAITTGNIEVLESERLCKKALDEKPYVMSYDIRKQFRTMPWHWIAWRSLKMDQIDRMEADE